MRLLTAIVSVLLLSACGSGSPTDTKPVPQPQPQVPAGQTLLVSGDIASAGGALTFTKAGDPLSGLTLTLPSGAFASVLNARITTSTNANLPTANGIIPISPVVHIKTGSADYARAPITIRIPARVPANGFPLIVMYDSASGVIEALSTIAYDSTSVTAMTRHLSNANLAPKATASGRVSAAKSGGGFAVTADDPPEVSMVIYYLPQDVLEADHDTGFLPGSNDWDFRAVPTEVSPASTLLGAAVTEMWYFNTRASPIPLYRRFAAVPNVEFSNRSGLRWAAVTDQLVSESFSAAVSVRQASYRQNPAYDDKLQFNTVRAAFAMASLNATRPVPMLVDLVRAGLGDSYFVVAYRSTGDQLFVGDPAVPGDAGRFLQFPRNELMRPYALPSALGGGAATNPVASSLGTAVPLAPIRLGYARIASGDIGNDKFPAAGLRSWFGQVYDTAYVVDSLRLWAQCDACGFGYSTALAPPPVGKLARGLNLYVLTGISASDSLGSLSSNGVKILEGDERKIGIPLASADAAQIASSGSSVRWLDWRQVTIRTLRPTILPAAPAPTIGVPVALQMSIPVDQLPSNVTYRWDFGDGKPTASAANNTGIQHTYEAAGTYTITGEIVDDRNTQVIGRATKLVTVGGGIIAWKFTTTNLALTFEGPIENHGESWPRDSTRLVRMSTGGSQGGIRLVEQQFVPRYGPTRTVAEGLFLLEAATLTTATLNFPTNENTFATSVFRYAPIALDPSPRVYTWEVVRAIQITPEPYCKDDSESFLRTGTATSGHVTGLTVHYCWDRFAPPQPGFEFQFAKPRMTIATDVTFSGNTAQGTITFTYLYWNLRTPPQKEIARMTFVATRL